MKKVLVIENERMVFLDIKITFSQLGYEVIYGNRRNIELVAESVIIPDLIILDIESVQRIEWMTRISYNRYAKFKDVPVILTTTGFKNSIGFCAKNKINLIGELYKPYEPNNLLTIYNAFLKNNNSPVQHTMLEQRFFTYNKYN